MVTGGAGFLGRVVVAKLKARGAAEILIPHQADFDLTTEASVVRMYEIMKPDVVFHLAAEVGGIGANMKNPGRYFFANMAMSLHLIEHARSGRNHLRISQVHASAIPRERALEWLSRGDERTIRNRKESSNGDARRVSPTIRTQIDLCPSSQFVWPRR